MVSTIFRPFADSVDKDETAQKVRSNLGFTLSDKDFFLSSFPKGKFLTIGFKVHFKLFSSTRVKYIC